MLFSEDSGLGAVGQNKEKNIGLVVAVVSQIRFHVNELILETATVTATLSSQL